MAIVNYQRDFIFLFEPYSASRSIRNVLLKLSGSQEKGWHHDSLSAVRDTLSLPSRIFCVLRNPLDRIATQYNHLTSWHYGGFDRFVHCELDGKNTIYYHSISSNIHLPFESITEALTHHLPEISQLPHLGRSHEKESYTPELEQFVRNRLKDDFQLWEQCLKGN